MRIRFILAILILLLACALQFWFASAGIFVNFILASLIAFAFYFDVWDLLVLVLFAVFIVNWQPSASLDIVIFGIIPIGAHAFHAIFRWTPWVAAPAAVIVGFAVLYLAVAPGAFVSHWPAFFEDLLGGLVFGGLAFVALDRLKAL